MPRNPSLRGFLRSKVLRSRIKHWSGNARDDLEDETLSHGGNAASTSPSSLSKPPVAIQRGGVDVRRSAKHSPTSTTYKQRSKSPATTNTVPGEDESASLLRDLFGEEDIDSGSESSPLLNLLRSDEEPGGIISLVSPTRKLGGGLTTENPVLKALKEELESLVVREADADARERELCRRQRGALIVEIGRREAEDWGEGRRRLKAKFDQDVKTLPEPVGVWEKKRLKRDRERVQRAVAGLERSRKKRCLERDNPDDDLDGEEKLRLGKTLKKKKPTKEQQVMGHWQSSLHGYDNGLSSVGRCGEGEYDED